MLVEQCQKISADEIVQQAAQQARQGLLSTGIDLNGNRVKLTTTRTQFGGNRVWFACPACERRCGVLLMHPLSQVVACRECLNLNYRKRRYKGMAELTQ